MNMYTNTKKSKKFILILVLLILFNFCYPKTVSAAIGVDDFVALPLKIVYFIEKGVLKFLNDIFTDDVHPAIESTASSTYNSERIKLYLTPENVIKGKFILFDANIFRDLSSVRPSSYFDYYNSFVLDGKINLRNIIAGWYYALRNFAIVALLSVLVYVGIRMILSTIAQDKAKYKTMFKDWLVALCLVVVMHYIMIGILNFTSMIVDAIGSGGQNSDNVGYLTERISGILSEEYEGDTYAYEVEEGGKTVVYEVWDGYAFAIVLLGIIGYTFIFAVKYLKREFTIIFLILLGPLSCITYPIDKISDGKAQAFNKWFSEFLYEVIIQPFHLLLYVVLIGSAAELASANVIYALVCFAVMIPAEKFVKEMFGFKDKLGSPLGAFAGGAVASQLFNKMKGGGSVSKSSGGGKEEGGSGELPVKTKSPELPGASSDGRTDRGIATSDSPELDSSSEEDEGGAGRDSEEAGIDTTDSPELEGGDSPAEGTAIDTTDSSELEDDEGTAELDVSDADESNEDDSEGNPSEDDEKQGRFRKGIASVKDVHNRKILKNYGTTKAKELAKKRAWRMTKGIGKFAGRTAKKTIIGATSAAGALLGAGVGAMFGHGAKGAGVGLAAGAKLGGSVGKLGDKVASKTGEYAKAFYKGATGKSSTKEKFKINVNNIDRARRNFKDRNGRLGSGAEINKELDKMYEMTKYGVKDSQLDDAMDLYNYNMETLNMDEATAKNTAIQSALLAQDYSRKDFNDPKRMQEAYDGLMKRYNSAGVNSNTANRYVKNIMNGAGSLRGVEKIALGTTQQTIDMTVPSGQQVAIQLGVAQSDEFNQEQLERVNELTLRLHKAGYSNKEIQNIGKGCANSRISALSVIDTYKMKVEFLEDKSAREQAKQYVASSKKIEASKVTEEQVKVEMKTRLDFVSVGAKKENLDSIRAVDEIHYGKQSKSDKQRALNVASKYSAKQMSSSREMDKAIKDYAKELSSEGIVSDDGIKKATEIFERAANFKGTDIVSTYTQK